MTEIPSDTKKYINMINEMGRVVGGAEIEAQLSKGELAPTKKNSQSRSIGYINDAGERVFKTLPEQN